MIKDREGSAVLVVIWMTGVLAVLALTFAGRVREASQEVKTAEAHLRADAAIDGELSQMVYTQLRSDQEQTAAAAKAAAAAREEKPVESAGASTPAAEPDAAASPAQPSGSQVADAVPPQPAALGTKEDPSDVNTGLSDAGIRPDKAAAITLIQQPITRKMAIGDVSLYLHAEPEAGRVDLNRGNPRVLRALLEGLVDRGVATKAMDATERGRKLAKRAGATVGAEPLPFLTVDAWLAATGLDAEAALKVRPYLTTYTQAQSVDLLYAKQQLIDVLPYLSRSQKEKIAKARKQSPQALTQALAQVAADPASSSATGDGSAAGAENDAGEDARPVWRVTVEATVPDVLRETEQFILAFTEAGAGTGTLDEQPQSSLALGSAKPKQEKEIKLPFVILDRRGLDTAPSSVAAAAGTPAAAP